MRKRSSQRRAAEPAAHHITCIGGRVGGRLCGKKAQRYEPAIQWPLSVRRLSRRLDAHRRLPSQPLLPPLLVPLARPRLRRQQASSPSASAAPATSCRTTWASPPPSIALRRTAANRTTTAMPVVVSSPRYMHMHRCRQSGPCPARAREQSPPRSWSGFPTASRNMPTRSWPRAAGPWPY